MAGQWRQTLRDYAYPRIGRKRVGEVSTADVLAILKPIWSSKPPTAKAVRNRISAVMRWAVAKGYRPDNPAGEAIAGVLPRNGNLSREHVSRCVHWLIGSQDSEMPPELPQTCSCPRHPSATPRCPSGAGHVRGAPSPRQATTNRVLVPTPSTTVPTPG